MSILCSSCGAELEDSATFCVKCGKPVSLFTAQPEAPQTTSGDMPEAENFGAQQPQPGMYDQQPYGGQPQFQQQPYGGQPQYQQPQYQQPYQNMNAFSQSANVYNQSQYMGLNETTFSPYSQTEQPVSVGQWMITTLLLCIPIVGIIYFIILAIGGPNTKKSLTNYARAALVWTAIIFVFYLILFIFLGYSLKESGFIRMLF